MEFYLPQKIEFVLDTLIKSGHKAYIVGGCVRDLLCGKKPHDYDITTSAMPNEVENLFEKTVATGIKHGTVTVIVEGEPVEVTTFRTEDAYTNNRHPKKVSFVTDVKSDLSRRDFTVNAMCYNKQEGLIDCFCGQSDIKTKTLKAVGDPQTRFSEDALRILRLFRFAATLGFDIETQTFNAALEKSDLLKNISAERIFAELQKTALGDHPDAICSLLKNGGLDKFYLKNGDLKNISKLENKVTLRTFALLNLTSTNFCKTLNNFKCSNCFKDYCLKMNYLSQNIINDDKVSIKNALNFAEKDIVYDILFYYRDILNIDISRRKALFDEITKNGEPYKISHLAVTGNDILMSGINGKSVGEKLNCLLNEVIKNPELNTREKLLNLICN